MNIVPELNLNKHPNVVKDNSIIDAENIMLSVDGAVLQNEPLLESNNVINDYLLENYEGDVNIIYILPCNNELLLFIKPNDENNTLHILRFEEKSNRCKVVLKNLEYNRGKLLGTFTYNKDNLIIAISEYFEDDSKNIPLKTLNLGKFEDTINSNTDFHSLTPKVKIPTVVTKYINGNAYKGWYYIFVRYKITKDDYTQWYNTNQSVIIGSYQERTLLEYFVSKNFDGDSGLKTDISSNNNINVSDSTDIANISFTTIISNLSNDTYAYYQLGFVCVSKDYTKSFISNDIEINDKQFNFTTTNIKEYNINDLIKTYYNYYNVKALDVVNNRLYIGNYRESNINSIISNVSLTGKLKTIIKDSEEIKTPIDIKRTFNIKGDGKYLLDRTVNSIRIKVATKGLQSIWVSAINTYDFIVNLFSDINIKSPLFIPFESTESTNFEYIKDINDEAIESIKKSVKLEDLFYVPKIDVNIIDGIDYSGYYIFDGYATYTKHEGRQYTISYEGQNYRIVNSDHYDNSLIYKETYIYDPRSIINKPISVLPNSYYNFFIHFVDEYGEISNGTHISNIKLIDDAGEDIVYENTLFKTPDINIDKTITLTIKLDKLPANIEGYFISYEQFEPTIIYKSYATINGKTIKVYDEKFNYDDSINFKFNKIKVYNTTNTEQNLNKKFEKGELIGDYDVLTKKLNVADSAGNILEETHLELTINSNINIKEAIIYLYNEDTDSIYKNKNKILVPCTDVIYDTNEHEINTKNAFRSANSCLYYPNKVYFDEATKTYMNQGATMVSIGVEPKPFYVYSFDDYFEIPNEFIEYKNEPQQIFFPNHNEAGKETFVVGSIVDIKNTVDLFNQPYTPIYALYPKKLFWNHPDNIQTNVFSQTFRRSNVIQDESYTNSWRKFEIEQYRNINENKGKIIKLISIGKYFIVHTEHSMFLFNGTDTIKSEEGNISLASVDIMNLSYQEILTSKLGYAGINKEYHGIIGTFGYIYYSEDDNAIYRYDQNKLEIIDSGITNYIKGIEDIEFGDDKERNRLLIQIKCNNNYYILSYNYLLNRFISFHHFRIKDNSIDLLINKPLSFYSTKNTIYINYNTNDINHNIINTFSNEYFADASISIIHTNKYELMKYLDFIVYKINKIDKSKSIDKYPVEGKDEHYASDAIEIYSEHCNTGYLEFNTSENLNSPNNYMTPYWRFGNWHFNAIRNKINDDIPDDEKSRVFGNWFVVKFYFDTNQKVEIESLEFNTSIAEI